MTSRRNRTPAEYVRYGLYMYFSGLSLRRVSERMSCFIKRNHVSIWNWIQRYHPKKISTKSRKVSEFIVDETMLKVGSEYVWLWVAIDAKSKVILALSISKERNMFIAERFLSRISRDYGNHPVSRWWYLVPYGLQIPGAKTPSPFFFSKEEKSLIERTVQYIKDRTGCFDDYFPCKVKNCKLKHVRNWLNLLVEYHNRVS